jgi:hypothetical protein
MKIVGLFMTGGIIDVLDVYLDKKEFQLNEMFNEAFRRLDSWLFRPRV